MQTLLVGRLFAYQMRYNGVRVCNHWWRRINKKKRIVKEITFAVRGGRGRRRRCGWSGRRRGRGRRGHGGRRQQRRGRGRTRQRRLGRATNSRLAAPPALRAAGQCRLVHVLLEARVASSSNLVAGQNS